MAGGVSALDLVAVSVAQVFGYLYSYWLQVLYCYDSLNRKQVVKRLQMCLILHSSLCGAVLIRLFGLVLVSMTPNVLGAMGFLTFSLKPVNICSWQGFRPSPVMPF